jgi:hypothetical protein
MALIVSPLPIGVIQPGSQTLLVDAVGTMPLK